jgi:hypothetical protein
MQRLREKIIFSLLGWLLLTIMTLAIVTRDPAQPGRSGGDLVALLASGYFTHWPRSASARPSWPPKSRRNDDQLEPPVVDIHDQLS